MENIVNIQSNNSKITKIQKPKMTCDKKELKESINLFAVDILSTIKSNKKSFDFVKQYDKKKLFKLDKVTFMSSLSGFNRSIVYSKCQSYDNKFMIGFDKSKLSYIYNGNSNVIHIIYYLIANLYHLKTTDKLSDNRYLNKVIQLCMTLDAVYTYHMSKAKSSFDFKPSIIINNYGKLID